MEENKYIDRLAKAASVESMTICSLVLSFTQYLLAINEVNVHAIPTGINWMTSIISYLKMGHFPKTTMLPEG